MTTVNVTEQKNTVTVNPTTNSVTITEGDATVVSVITEGPQGPPFASSGATLNDANKVDNSIVYFDSSSGTFKADQTRTVENLVEGGNF